MADTNPAKVAWKDLLENCEEAVTLPNGSQMTVSAYYAWICNDDNQKFKNMAVAQVNQQANWYTALCNDVWFRAGVVSCITGADGGKGGTTKCYSTKGYPNNPAYPGYFYPVENWPAKLPATDDDYMKDDDDPTKQWKEVKQNDPATLLASHDLKPGQKFFFCGGAYKVVKVDDDKGNHVRVLAEDKAKQEGLMIRGVKGVGYIVMNYPLPQTKDEARKKYATNTKNFSKDIGIHAENVWYNETEFFEGLGSAQTF